MDFKNSEGNKKKGGFGACTFVFVLGAFENMGFAANLASMVLYFNLVMKLDYPTSSNTLTNYMGSACLLTLLGVFISDTFLNRLYTCLIFGSIEVVALLLLAIQARFKDQQPDPLCESGCVKGGAATMFYGSLCLLALGAGGVKGALPALGADQFDEKDQKGKQQLTSYFNWYILSTTFGAIFGVTIIVWVGMNKARYWGFFLGTVTALTGFIGLALGKPFNFFPPLGNSPLVKIAQVIAVAIKNRRLTLPEHPDELFEINDKDTDLGEEKLSHTNQFKLPDKGAILPEGVNPQPWKVCTVTQVEEVNLLTRMMPIIASTIIMNACLAQLQAFSVHQGYVINFYIL